MKARSLTSIFLLALVWLAGPTLATAQPKTPADLDVEVLPKDGKSAKIVLIAGTNTYKPGEHEYVAGCAVLRDLLRQTPGVFPVLALDWPKNPETLAGAKAVVFFLDGGDKHPLLKGDHLAQMQKLADAGVGFVQMHQGVDVPKDLGERMRGMSGAAWEKGFSQRGHWIADFKSFPKHAVFNGVTPFKIDDGWLFQLRFAAGEKGVTPLLHTANPKAKAKAKAPAPTDAVVAWAFERPGAGRSFTFTGAHLHVSLAQEGYRRFLVNGILWSAGLEVPAAGAPVALEKADLEKYLKPAVKKSK